MELCGENSLDIFRLCGADDVASEPKYTVRVISDSIIALTYNIIEEVDTWRAISSLYTTKYSSLWSVFA